jgi:hypothetical protein
LQVMFNRSIFANLCKKAILRIWRLAYSIKVVQLVLVQSV